MFTILKTVSRSRMRSIGRSRELVICSCCFGTSTKRFQKVKLKTSSSEEEKETGYSDKKETHFGFETVSEQEKAHKVKAVFENVADRYDLMNDCMSVGIHRVWKDIFVSKVKPGKTTKLIDVAGGTGDIAFRFLKYVNIRPDFERKLSLFPNELPDQRALNEVEAQYMAMNKDDPEGKPYDDTASESINNTGRSVLVCDINGKMLDVGKKRAASSLTLDQQRRIDWMEGDAENLRAIPDNTFDAYTIAFGIRNCIHVDKVLCEAYRVLKHGGRFYCLEFSHVSNPLIHWIYDQYSFQVIPAMGQVIAGDWDSYKYLVESIRKFPKQEQFKKMIQQAGFKFVKYENLTFGVAAIHCGFKI